MSQRHPCGGAASIGIFSTPVRQAAHQMARQCIFPTVLVVFTLFALSSQQGGLNLLQSSSAPFGTTFTAYSSCQNYNGDTYFVARDGVYKVCCFAIFPTRFARVS
jgi:hypothetical protein